MNYYNKQLFDDYQDNDVIKERYELAISRIKEIKDETTKWSNITDYFLSVSSFIIYVDGIFELINTNKFSTLDIDKLKEINNNLYNDILPNNYSKSYANPDYSIECLGEYGQVLSFLYAEIRSIIVYAFEGRNLEMAITVELFLEVYGMFKEDELPKLKYVKECLYYHFYDYSDIMVAYRIRETLDPSLSFINDLIHNSNLDDINYLYQYGEYITDNEIASCMYLNSLSEDKINQMAATYVDGFIRGFDTMRIDLSPKKTVNIRYSIGQERMVKAAIKMFKDNGLEAVIFRYPISKINRRLTSRVGITATVANKQYEYDHRMDDAIFLDKQFIERKLDVLSTVYEEYKDLAAVYAGPAVIEVFGENPFTPTIKESTIKYDKKQQELTVEYSSKSATITNKFIPRDKYSFTIIAYPIKEIGDNYEEIFTEIVKVNTLDNDLYTRIQQSIIDTLDTAKYVHILGKNDNKTDIKVMLADIKDSSKETKFENCVADVNIPVGEVFTSPVLKGTNGILNVSEVYLNDLKYSNLTLNFEDGKIKEYTCSNFDNEDENKNFIKENLMFNHDTLPIGEFAIGTNTTAYVMSKKYDIIYKLPILIVEKMGPHFAVGDTCYSYSEDNPMFNPDGKEVIARDNECSIHRKTDSENAYFNCHTDITIPYDEIKAIYAVKEDGTSITIIEDGRFVLDGTSELNKAFD